MSFYFGCDVSPLMSSGCWDASAGLFALMVFMFLLVLVVSIGTKGVLVFMVVTFDFFLQHTLLGHSHHAGGFIVLTNMASAVSNLSCILS